MTGFIIFTVVLTIAYIIYYTTMISIDLAAQKKAAQTEEEIIDTGNQADEVDEFATKHVVEDIKTGGFTFINPKPTEEAIPIIEEAAEGTMEENQVLENATDSTASSSEPEDIEHEEHTDNTDDETIKGNTNEDNRLNEDEDENEENVENEEQDQNCEFEGLTTVTFTEEEEEPEQETFKEEDAFNPDLRQNTYGVKKIYEAQVSPEVQSHADTVNSSMEATVKRCMSMDNFNLKESLRKREQSNIVYRDVYSKF